MKLHIVAAYVCKHPRLHLKTKNTPPSLLTDSCTDIWLTAALFCFSASFVHSQMSILPTQPQPTHLFLLLLLFLTTAKSIMLPSKYLHRVPNDIFFSPPHISSHLLFVILPRYWTELSPQSFISQNDNPPEILRLYMFLQTWYKIYHFCKNRKHYIS